MNDTSIPQRQMPAVELRRSLRRAVERIEAMRADYAKNNRDYDHGAATGLDLALDAIHVWTHGEFGKPFGEGGAK